MEKAAQHVARSNVCMLGRPWSRIKPWIRRLEIKASMRPSGVVVRGVGAKYPLQVAEAQHQHPVQALRPDRADPPLGERVRSRGPDRGLDDSHALGAEHLIEGTGELGIPVADEELEAAKPLLDSQVSRLLGDPRRVGVPGDAEDEHATGCDLDREEHVQRAKPRRLHSEEVQGQDPSSLGPEELPPGGTRSPGSRAEARRPKERADLRGRHSDAEFQQLAPDPDAPPPWVLPVG